MRLIDADALLDVIDEMIKRAAKAKKTTEEVARMGELFHFGTMVLERPTVEPPQGEWVEKKFFLEDSPEYERIMWVCDVCGKQGGCTNYCPHCGAKMKGGEA